MQSAFERKRKSCINFNKHRKPRNIASRTLPKDKQHVKKRRENWARAKTSGGCGCVAAGAPAATVGAWRAHPRHCGCVGGLSVRACVRLRSCDFRRASRRRRPGATQPARPGGAAPPSPPALDRLRQREPLAAGRAGAGRAARERVRPRHGAGRIPATRDLPRDLESTLPTRLRNGRTARPGLQAGGLGDGALFGGRSCGVEEALGLVGGAVRAGGKNRDGAEEAQGRPAAQARGGHGPARQGDEFAQGRLGARQARGQGHRLQGRAQAPH